MSTTATNWAGNVTFAAARTHRPDSLDELRRIVAHTGHIRAIGTAHSFSQVADTTHDLVRLDGLPRTVEIDAANSTVTVAASMRYADFTGLLDRSGHALANLASLPHISVAGSCATGTHGSGPTHRSLAAAVTALRLVTADGDTVVLRRDTPDFAGTVVALGALGVVTHVTLDVEPAYEMAQRVRLDVPLDDLAGSLDDVLGAAYSVSVFTDWRDAAAVWLKYRTDQPRPTWACGRPAPHDVHPVPGAAPEFCSEQLDVPGRWYERLPHFRPEFTPSAGDELQSEFYLARADAAAAFAAIREIGDLVAPVVHIAEIRAVRADDLWLSPAYGRDSVTFHFTWIADAAAVAPVLAAAEERLMPLGARPHWGKLTTAAPADIIGRYERADDFARLMSTYDRTGKFRNPFVDNLFPAS
ncbi:MAG TPA: D-arabinono-1,4-lactone oxidase [Pseudonocardiaceae bacterium]